LRCSCGAILPEDARFCHKCGAPQYEEDIARMNAVEEPLPTLPPPPLVAQVHPPSRIGFTNGRAVLISLAVAAMSFLAIVLIANVAPPLLFPILVAAGFASVRIYIGRTMESLTPSGGAALGVMTWLWLYLVVATGSCLMIFTALGHEAVKEAVKTLKNPDQAQQIIDHPSVVVPSLILILLVGIVSGALGGILAVRWQPRNGPSH
jgi:hypothetical protein